MRKLIVGLATALAALVPSAAAAEAEAPARTESIKIGSLAPGESPWGQVFRVWQKAVRERTKLPKGQKTADGKPYALDITFFWNGQQGDESAMVGKMKSGQLDGAAITGVGLAQIHRPILVLQMPGLFQSWAKLDHARDALKGQFEKAVGDAGFALVGWGDVGLAHSMSKGFPVYSPADLKGKRPYVWRDDPIGPAVFQVVGGVTPVPLGVPEVLPQLNSGAVNVITAPALAAEQLQWASRLDHVNTQVVGVGIGALVLASRKLDSLPGDQKAVLLETGAVAGRALTARIRNEDAQAMNRLKAKMTVYESNQAQRDEWDKVFKEVRSRLGRGTFPADLVKKVEDLAK